jgi:pyruvate formate lyase activating enzyme
MGEMGLTLAAGAAAGAAFGAETPPAPDPVQEARFYEKLDNRAVRCTLCPRGCVVPDGRRGYCRVRENRGGKYYSLAYGRACTANADPIEKKPLYHVYPGTKAYSIATVGCNLACKFCQNWDISQAKPEDVTVPYRSPQAIALEARRAGTRTIAYTYSEPIVFHEYITDCAKAARDVGIESVMVSNGFIQEQPLRALFPVMRAIKIDLKAFTQSFYQDICDASLKPVQDTLERLAGSGVWFEIVVLLIPTLNDGPDDLKKLAAWVVRRLGPDVPVHFTRYHPMYRLRNLPPTPTDTLVMARELAMKEGCHFVYTGNVPGLTGEDTACPSCHATVIRRYGYRVLENALNEGRCAKCGKAVPGVWG